MSTPTPTAALHDLGQSLWLDNITRALLDDGTLARYARELSVTGLTSNPTIFNLAVRNSAAYDATIAEHARRGRAAEEIFFALALEDLTRAADLFRPVHERTGGLDGWVSLEVSPRLADDTAGTLRAARDLHARAARPNLFIKIPGTPAGLPAIEEATAAGVPVNVTLLFTRGQYLAAAEAWMRGVERRIAAGLDPRVCSVASLFISRWDAATAKRMPPELSNRLGLAIGADAYAAYRALLAGDRWQRLANFGVPPQRLLMASTGTKDPTLSDHLYVRGLAAPLTVNTIPEATLLAFADHGMLGPPLPGDGGDAGRVLAEVAASGIDLAALGDELQSQGAAAFVKSWDELLQVIAEKAQHAGGAS